MEDNRSWDALVLAHNQRLRTLREAISRRLRQQRATGACLMLGMLLSGLAVAETAPPFMLKWGGLGTGIGQFVKPTTIASDHSGNVFIVDVQLGRIQRFDRSGQFEHQWPGPFVGIESGTSGFVYVSATDVGKIFKLDVDGNVIAEFVADVAGPVAIDPVTEDVYVAAGNIVRKFTADGMYVGEWTTVNTIAASNDGIAVGESGNVYVAEGGASDLVWKYSPDGVLLTSWGGGGGSGDGELKLPRGIAVDAEENVYVCDAGNFRVQKFTSSGVFLTKWGRLGTGDGEFGSITDIAVDGDGGIYVVDSSNYRIQKFGDAPTAVAPASWGQIKNLYRDRPTTTR